MHSDVRKFDVTLKNESGKVILKLKFDAIKKENKNALNFTGLVDVTETIVLDESSLRVEIPTYVSEKLLDAILLKEDKTVNYNLTQLSNGIKVEREHTKFYAVAERIAKHHLAEFKEQESAGYRYYEFLEKMETAMKKSVNLVVEEKKKTSESEVRLNADQIKDAADMVVGRISKERETNLDAVYEYLKGYERFSDLTVNQLEQVIRYIYSKGLIRGYESYSTIQFKMPNDRIYASIILNK